MAIKNWKWRNVMKVRMGDRVEWKRGNKSAGTVVGFDNRSALIKVDGGILVVSVPARELTVVEKRPAQS